MNWIAKKLEKIRKYLPVRVPKRRDKFLQKRETEFPDQIMALAKTLYEIDLYYKQAREKQTEKEKIWETLLDYLAQHLPPKGFLLYLKRQSQESTGAAEFLDKFEELLQKIYDELNDQIKKAKVENERLLFRQYKKTFLKIWQQFAIHLEPPLQAELVELIIEDGDDDPWWIQFCIAHLDKVASKVSDSFMNAVKKLASVDITDVDIPNPTLLQKENQAVKSVLNTQLALFGNKNFDWAHLNIARFTLTKDKLDRYLQGNEIDDYVDWHFEQAVSAGAKLSNIDLIVAAYAQFPKKNYAKVIDLLENFDQADGNGLIIKYKLLLGSAHGKLVLSADGQGDSGKAIQLLEEIKAENLLPVNEHFLLCQLLVRFKGIAEAQAAFADLDVHAIKTEKMEVVELAWQITAFDKIESFLEQAVKEEPNSVRLLSFLCELCRFHRNRFAEADSLIDRIGRLEADHHWVVIKKCTDYLDEGKFEAAENLVIHLPNEGIWDQEANLLNGRIELKKGAANEAEAFFSRLKYTNRIDYKYWNAVVHAHKNRVQAAISSIEGIPEDEYFREKILGLRGRLLLAQGSYQEALDVFNMLPAKKEFEIYKAWTYLNLQKYDQALALVKDEKSAEEIYLKAQAYDLMNGEDKAYHHYKQFIQKAEPHNYYLPQAIDRFCLLVIDKEAIEDAEWLLEDARLAHHLSGDRRIHLYAIKKAWVKVIELLLARSEEADVNNILFAYQQLLLGFIRNKKWKEAKEIIEKLNDLQEPVNEYHDFLVRAELLNDMQKIDKKIEYEHFDEIKDESIQIALSLHKFINGRIQFNEALEKIESWAEMNANVPEPALLLLIMSVFNNDKLKSQECAGKLQGMLNRFKDEETKLIAKAFVAMALDVKAIPVDHLLPILASSYQKLPISVESFWHRVILSLAQQNVEQAINVMGHVEKSIKMPQGDKAAIYANNAIRSLNQGQEQLAVQDLEKALGA